MAGGPCWRLRQAGLTAIRLALLLPAPCSPELTFLSVGPRCRPAHGPLCPPHPPQAGLTGPRWPLPFSPSCCPCQSAWTCPSPTASRGAGTSLPAQPPQRSPKTLRTARWATLPSAFSQWAEVVCGAACTLCPCSGGQVPLQGARCPGLRARGCGEASVCSSLTGTAPDGLASRWDTPIPWACAVPPAGTECEGEGPGPPSSQGRAPLGLTTGRGKRRSSMSADLHRAGKGLHRPRGQA